MDVPASIVRLLPRADFACRSAWIIAAFKPPRSMSLPDKDPEICLLLWAPKLLSREDHNTSSAMPIQPGSSPVPHHAVANALIAEFGHDVVIAPSGNLAKYLNDWSGDCRGRTLAILKPRDASQVSATVRFCYENGLAIVPQGGNTGLVGGAIDPTGGSVLLSLERLNRIRNINPLNLSAIVEAGCILSNVKEAVAAQGCFFPVALGAQGSAHIGGIVSTNAGGTNVVKYGMTRDSILGLEVVLADGTVWGNLNGLRKDNRGPDPAQIFIGGEGVFGIVTAACLKLSPMPKTRETAYVGCGGFEAAMALLYRLRGECHEFISGFEVMSNECLMMARLVDPDLRLPVSEAHPVHILVELSSTGSLPLRDILETLLAEEISTMHIADAVIAQNGLQADTFWKIRELIVEGHSLNGYHVRSDVSVQLDLIPELAERLRHMLDSYFPEWMPQTYGHAGDGNIHFNAIPSKALSDADARRIGKRIETEIFNVVEALTGSYSAEHGVGRTKRDRLCTTDPGRLRLLSKFKQALDPQSVLNPDCLLARPEADA